MQRCHWSSLHTNLDLRGQTIFWGIFAVYWFEQLTWFGGFLTAPEKDELDQLTIAYGNNFFCHHRWTRRGLGNCRQEERILERESCLCFPWDSHHPATSCHPPGSNQCENLTLDTYFMHMRWEKCTDTCDTLYCDYNQKCQNQDFGKIVLYYMPKDRNEVNIGKKTCLKAISWAASSGSLCSPMTVICFNFLIWLDNELLLRWSPYPYQVCLIIA